MQDRKALGEPEIPENLANLRTSQPRLEVDGDENEVRCFEGHSAFEQVIQRITQLA